LPYQLLMVGNQSLYLAAQLSWTKKMQPYIEFTFTPVYLFFYILQTEAHLFLLGMFRVVLL
jgi:hypothetical protein